MKTDLNILLIEDSDSDAQLIERELKAAHLSFRLTLVQSESELRRQLKVATPDLILSDHGLPSFDGFTALEIVRGQAEALPFIFVSGSNDQGMVAEMFERGATDYVYKHDLHDLVPAVRHALEPQTQTESRPEAPAPPRDEYEPPPQRPSNYVRVLLCPECLLARDESGMVVDVADYFVRHQEIVVLHYRCDKCSAWRSSD